jgi:hypothetical protein
MWKIPRKQNSHKIQAEKQSWVRVKFSPWLSSKQSLSRMLNPSRGLLTIMALRSQPFMQTTLVGFLRKAEERE